MGNNTKTYTIHNITNNNGNLFNMKQRLKKFLFSFFKDQLLEYESPYKDIPVYCNEKYDIEEVVTQVYFDNETLKEAYKSYHESYDAAIETAKRQMFEEVMKHVKVDIEV